MSTPLEHDLLQTEAPEPGSRKNLRLGLMLLAVLSTIAASACCLLPLALVLVGITGAWMTTLTSLQPVTPLFTGIALASLGWAGYLVFRPAPVCAGADAEACRSAGRFTKGLFFACALLIAAVLCFPLFAPYFY